MVVHFNPSFSERGGYQYPLGIKTPGRCGCACRIYAPLGLEPCTPAPSKLPFVNKCPSAEVAVDERLLPFKYDVEEEGEEEADGSCRRERNPCASAWPYAAPHVWFMYLVGGISSASVQLACARGCVRAGACVRACDGQTLIIALQ